MLKGFRVQNRILEKTSAVSQFFLIWQFGLTNGNYCFRNIFDAWIFNFIFRQYSLNIAVRNIGFMICFRKSETYTRDDEFPFKLVFEYGVSVIKRTIL